MLKKNVVCFILSCVLFFSFSLSAYANSLVDDLLRHPGDPIGGNPYGRITVVEFFDYQCSHCMKMADTIDAIIKSNPDVRIVFKDYPILSSMSQFAAKAAIASNKQHKYYVFNHALLNSTSPLTPASVFNIAESLGIDTKALQKDMAGDDVKQQIKFNYALTQKLNLNGTPAFFIGKTQAKSDQEVNFVLGEISQQDLQNAIEKARS